MTEKIKGFGAKHDFFSVKNKAIFSTGFEQNLEIIFMVLKIRIYANKVMYIIKLGLFPKSFDMILLNPPGAVLNP